MPSNTFLNLPEDKQTRLMDAASREFSAKPYNEVSINKIIQDAGIPRGSFYMYFQDKEELFHYLLEDIQAQVVRVFSELLHKNAGDLFQLQIALYDDIICRGDQCPMLERCFRLLQINPGIDLQKLLGGLLQQEFPPELMEKIHLSSLTRQDTAYVRRVFLMTLGVLGRSIMDSLLQPERTVEIRLELEAQLDIIKYGCLRSSQTGPADT